MAVPRFDAAIPWIALLAASCTVAPVDLEGKRCPCAPGYVCVDQICHRSSNGRLPGRDSGFPDELPDGSSRMDAGTRRDSGARADAGRGADAGGRIDSGPRPDGGGVRDSGTTVDTGPPTTCPAVPLDKSCPTAMGWIQDGDACRRDCITPGCFGTLTCPPGRPCILNCPFASACTATTLVCGDEGCRVECSAGGCGWLTIECGAGPCACEPGPKLMCNNSCDCPNGC